MKNLQLKILSVRHETRDVHSIKLEKGGFDFKPGQYAMIELPADDPEGNMRPLSIASSPTEDFLLFSTKERDTPFKHSWHGMKVGETVNLKGPMGIFTLQEDAKEIVFLSGGIGITPFRSMIKYASDKKLGIKMTLLFSNMTANDIVFEDDFEIMLRENPNLKVVHTVTDDASYSGRKGRISEELIKEFCKDPNNVMFYACGPLAMVSGLTELLKSMKVPPQNVRKELFAGY